MYTDEEFDQLEQEQHRISEEALIAMFVILDLTHSQLETELRRFYQKYGKDGIVTYAEARKWVSDRNHQRRLVWLVLLIRKTFSLAFDKIKPEFESLISTIVKIEFDFFTVALETPKLNWGNDGLTWVDRLADDINAWEYTIVGDIKRQMLAKKPIDDVLDQMDKRFTTMKNVLKRLGMTEATASASLARKMALKELGISKYKFYARADERTCEHCGALHGLIFPITAYEVGVTASPIHTNCRCWEVPIRE